MGIWLAVPCGIRRDDQAMDRQQFGLVVEIHRGPSSVKIRRTDETDAVRVKTDDGDLLSAALCSSIPALTKPDYLIRLNAILIEWKEEWCRRGRRI